MNAVADQLEAVFNDIAQTRMAGLPICNPALHVQVVGLREWQGRWVGVLLTPWTINLVLMPGEAPLAALAAEEKMAWEFPSGKYEFMALHEPALGDCQTCSLISPIIDIETQDYAVAIAKQVMAALFVPAPGEPARAAMQGEMLETAQPVVEPLVKKSVSRREFLRGGFLGI